jgi:hypothetical protein
MTVEQYSALVQILPAIDTTLEEMGETIPERSRRPPQHEHATKNAPQTVDRSSEAEAEPVPESEQRRRKGESRSVACERKKKANIEATSDEDEEEQD